MWPTLFSFLAAAALAASAEAPPRTPETFSATAVTGEGAAERTLPMNVVIDQYTTADQHAAASGALKEGASVLHTLFATWPDIGSIAVGDRKVAVKYAYRRPQSPGRITLVANTHLAFLDPGGDKNKANGDFDFAYVVLDFSLPGFGAGEIDPAVKLTTNPDGQIITERYGAAVIRLRDVEKR